MPSPTPPEITINSVIAACSEQVASHLGGESIILSLQTAQYYGLGDVGARIWELVQQPMRVADIRDAILNEYEVEPERCEADVLNLLRQLAAEKLIEVREGDGHR